MKVKIEVDMIDAISDVVKRLAMDTGADNLSLHVHLQLTKELRDLLDIFDKDMIKRNKQYKNIKSNNSL